MLNQESGVFIKKSAATLLNKITIITIIIRIN